MSKRALWEHVLIPWVLLLGVPTAVIVLCQFLNPWFSRAPYKVAREIQVPNHCFPVGIAIDPAGKFLFVTGQVEGSILKYDLTSDGAPSVLAHGHYSDMAVSPDGNHLAACSDGSLGIIDLKTGELRPFLGLESGRTLPRLRNLQRSHHHPGSTNRK